MNVNICSVIVTYNIGKDLLKCFNSIENQVSKVIIIDNGSGDETKKILSDLEQKDRVKVFYCEDNIGIAAAQNIGVKYAIDNGYDWVLTLDHDSEAATDMVVRMLEGVCRLQEDGIGNVGIIGANLRDINVETFSGEKKIFSEGQELSEVRTCVSSGSLIKTAVFSDIGFFNESLFLYFVEEEFCLRCSKNWRIYVCRSAILRHREGAREMRRFLWKKIIYRNYNLFARYYICRNVIYMLKHHILMPIYCLKILERILVEFITVLMFDKQRWKLLKYMIRGVFDGIAGRYGKLDVD